MSLVRGNVLSKLLNMMLGQDGCLIFSLYFSVYLKDDRLIQNDLAVSLVVQLSIFGFTLLFGAGAILPSLRLTSGSEIHKF